MNRTYAVVDDFLEQSEHLALWNAFQAAAASPAEAREWNRVYQLTDGEDLVRSDFKVRRPSLRDGTADGLPGPLAPRLFSEKLSALLTGDRRPLSLAPWTGFSLAPWVYRPGDGLEWHSDTGWLGAHIYYMHPVWRSSWGGELLVAAGDTTPSGEAAAAGSDNSRNAAETVCRTGGAFIYPRPNRLVLLRGGTLHCIKKVESAAGNAFRASLSGFFFNTGGIDDSSHTVG